MHRGEQKCYFNEKLVTEAFELSNDIDAKKELVEVALKEFAMTRKRKCISELRGKKLFAQNYDHKSMREK